MSLLLWKGRIAAVVAGEVTDEATVREHLRGCDECRAHYDALTAQARLLSVKESPASSDSRELARLMGALDGPPVEVPRASRWWTWAPIAGVAAALLLFLIPRGVPEVTVRGGQGSAVAQSSVRIYAMPADGSRPLRLAAEFPGSGEGRLLSDELVQVKPAQPVPGTRYVADREGARVELHDNEATAIPPGTWRVLLIRGAETEQVGLLEVGRSEGRSDGATE